MVQITPAQTTHLQQSTMQLAVSRQFQNCSNGHCLHYVAGSRYQNGVTTRPAYVFVPGGTYKIKSQVNLLVNTFLVGDPLNMPIFLADPALGTNPVIQGFDNSQQSTTNFYTALRNIKIDTTKISTSTKAVALNWAVSQGCSLFNVIFNMPDSSSHIGITMSAVVSGTDEGGGSGTLISDCVSSFEIPVDADTKYL